MTLSETENNIITREYVQDAFVSPKITANVNTTDIKAAATALDAFITNNFTAINNALPEPFKTLATSQQKLRLFKSVVNQLGLQ